MSLPHAVIRADASVAIGGGHVVRCLALAQSLTRDGWMVSFAGTVETPSIVPALTRSPYRWISLEHPASVDEMQAAVPGGCDLLVIDHYGLDAVYETACRSWARKIVAIDDLANRNHDCDILIDPMPDRPISSYLPRVGKGSCIASGPSYALLRPVFASVRATNRDRHVQRVLLSLGTADTSNQLATLVAAVAGTTEGVSIDVAVGAAARDLPSIREAARVANARLHVDATNMAELMRDSDIAVIAAGGTTWEAACLGLPMVLMITADNQRAVAQTVAARSAGIVAATTQEAASYVRALVADAGLRNALSSAASALCDGFGTQRALLLANPESDSAGRAVTLRPATLDDTDLILRWQQAPETRRFARNPAVPTAEVHRAWMQQTLGSRQSLLHLVVRDNVSVGLLRLDRTNNDDYEISIVTDPATYRQGIGLAALKLARRFLPDARLIGQILPGNEPSRRLFEKAGFRAVGNGWFAHENLHLKVSA